MDREPYEVLGVGRFAPWSEIRSAYRALARRFHADGWAPDPRAMAAVNAAYEALERARRAAAEAGAVGGGSGSGSVTPGIPMGPGRPDAAPAGVPPRPPKGSLLARMQAARGGDSPILDFGQYAGWRIAEVAEHDPRYLVWLSRHSSGIRYRKAIEEALGGSRDIGWHAAVLS